MSEPVSAPLTHHASDCEFMTSDNPWSPCTCGFGRPAVIVVSEPQPDFSTSKTGQSELWKNSLFPMHERLEMADGAIAFRDAIIAKLRAQLHDAHDYINELEAK